MNKYDFLRKLDKELSPLDQEERKELLAFYEERFYNGTIYENKTEEQVIAELESPEQIARNILHEYGISPREAKARKTYINKEKINAAMNGASAKVQSAFTESNFNMSAVIVLIIVDLFILSWLIPTLFSVVVSLFGSLLSYIGVLAILIGPTTIYDKHAFLFATGVYIFLFLFSLVILDLFIWVMKKSILYHLRVFKYKKYPEFNKKISKYSVEAWFKKHRLFRFLKNISGIVALFLVVVSGWFLFSNYGEIEELYINQEVLTDVTTIENVISEDEYEIYLDLEDIEVEFVSTTGSDIVITRVHSEDLENEVYSVQENTNSVEISHSLPNFIWNFGFSIDNLSQLFNRDEIKIEVPEGVVLTLIDVNTTNGAVDIRGIQSDNIYIHTSNGEIEISNVIVEDELVVSTTNGQVKVFETFALIGGSLDVDTSNGRINVEEIAFNMITLDSSNGRIIAGNVNVDKNTGTTLIADTSNGDIIFEDVYVSVVTLDTSNGNIEYYNEDSSYSVDLTRDTSNGSYSGNVN